MFYLILSLFVGSSFFVYNGFVFVYGDFPNSVFTLQHLFSRTVGFDYSTLSFFFAFSFSRFISKHLSLTYGCRRLFDFDFLYEQLFDVFVLTNLRLRSVFVLRSFVFFFGFEPFGFGFDSLNGLTFSDFDNFGFQHGSGFGKRTLTFGSGFQTWFSGFATSFTFFVGNDFTSNCSTDFNAHDSVLVIGSNYSSGTCPFRYEDSTTRYSTFHSWFREFLDLNYKQLTIVLENLNYTASYLSFFLLLASNFVSSIEDFF